MGLIGKLTLASAMGFFILGLTFPTFADYNDKDFCYYFLQTINSIAFWLPPVAFSIATGALIIELRHLKIRGQGLGGPNEWWH